MNQSIYSHIEIYTYTYIKQISYKHIDMFIKHYMYQKNNLIQKLNNSKLTILEQLISEHYTVID